MYRGSIRGLGISKTRNRKQVLRKINSEKKETKRGILEEKKRKKDRE